MPKVIQLAIHPEYEQKYKSGYPLLFQDAVTHPQLLETEGAIVRLSDRKNRFIANAYLGKQNKGFGWVLSYDEQEAIDLAFFIHRLRSALSARESYFHDPLTTAFRLFNGEGDGIGGLTIDYFADYYCINWYSRGIYHFRELVVAALQNLTTCKGIYQKKRFDTKGHYINDDDFVAGERAPSPLIVQENGVKLAVYLNEGAMVGVFLDQREVRQKLREHFSAGKTVLNTFSYTGAFSVFAALGGAAKTTSVDLANRSRPKTIEQFKLNGIDAETQAIIVEDVFQYFKYARRKGLQFDTVILDPPSFARSKKTVFSAEKHYTGLLEDAISITSNGGTIIASTNCSTFGMSKFKSYIRDAFQSAGSSYQLLHEYRLPEDFKTNPAFPEGNYLKVVFVQKQ